MATPNGRKTFTLEFNSNTSGATNIWDTTYQIQPLSMLGLTQDDLNKSWNMRFTLTSTATTLINQASQPYLLNLTMLGAGKSYNRVVGRPDLNIVGWLNCATDTSTSRYFNNNQLTSGLTYYENLGGLSQVSVQLLDNTYAVLGSGGSLNTVQYMLQVIFTQC